MDFVINNAILAVDLAPLEPFIVNWSRLEPLPVTPDLQAGLQARVGDPLWLLGRQWQFNEFQGIMRAVRSTSVCRSIARASTAFDWIPGTPPSAGAQDFSRSSTARSRSRVGERASFLSAHRRRSGSAATTPFARGGVDPGGQCAAHRIPPVAPCIGSCNGRRRCRLDQPLAGPCHRRQCHCRSDQTIDATRRLPRADCPPSRVSRRALRKSAGWRRSSRLVCGIRVVFPRRHRRKRCVGSGPAGIHVRHARQIARWQHSTAQCSGGTQTENSTGIALPSPVIRGWVILPCP